MYILLNPFLAIAKYDCRWKLTDEATNQDTLSTLFGEMSLGLFILLILGFLFLIARPMFGMLGVIVAIDLFDFPEFMLPPTAGLFIACIAAIILGFTGAIVLNAMDTVFMLHAITKDGGDVEEDKKIYLDEMMKQPILLVA